MAVMATPLLPACAARDGEAFTAAASRLRSALVRDPGLPDLVRFATLAANGHNTQPWRFVARPSGVSLLPDLSRRTPIVDPDDHHLYVSLGCAAENLCIAAAARGLAAESALRDGAAGLDVDWVAAPAREDGLFAAIPGRQSTRSVYAGRPVSTAQLRELAAAARIEGVQLRIVTSMQQREQLLELVVRGNGAQMDDPGFRDELRNWIRFEPAAALATGDGLFSACSGSPTLPSWLGRGLFPLVFRKRAENDRYAQQLRSSAGLAVFVGDRADPDHWIRVGRSFQRFALRATAIGLRHAHVNQPVEVPAVRADLARWLGTEQRPDLVVRFGYAEPLPMSLRRPVEAVMDA
jgi:hypothetical protein